MMPVRVIESLPRPMHLISKCRDWGENMFGEDLVTYTWISDDYDAMAYKVDEEVYDGPLQERLWDVVDGIMGRELFAMVQLDVKPPLVSFPESHIHSMGTIVTVRLHRSLNIV